MESGIREIVVINKVKQKYQIQEAYLAKPQIEPFREHEIAVNQDIPEVFAEGEFAAGVHATLFYKAEEPGRMYLQKYVLAEDGTNRGEQFWISKDQSHGQIYKTLVDLYYANWIELEALNLGDIEQGVPYITDLTRTEVEKKLGTPEQRVSGIRLIGADSMTQVA